MIVAFLTIDPEHVTRLLTGVLAVAGGYVVGMVAAWLAIFMVEKRLKRVRSPQGLRRVIMHVAGVCGALLVALIVFGSGGGPGGGGKASGDPGTGPRLPIPGTGVAPERPEPSTPRVTPAPDKPEPPKETLVTVLVLSGADVQQERFYVIDGDDRAKNLAELADALKTRRAAAPSLPLGVVLKLGPRADRNNSGVLDLERLAQESGYRLILPGGGR